jgi:hypothetical protein
MQQVKKRAMEKRIAPPAFVKNTSKSIAYIKNCFNAGLKANKNAPGKVLTVIYEHLLETPEKVTKKICKYLGIEWNDLMLHPGDKEHLGGQALTKKSNEIWYNSETYNQNLVIPNKEKWKNELSLGQQLKITMAFIDNKNITQYGYDFSVDSLGHGNRFLLRNFLYCLFLGRNLYKSVVIAIKKFPGSSLIKNALLVIPSFFRTKV